MVSTGTHITDVTFGIHRNYVQHKINTDMSQITEKDLIINFFYTFVRH